MDVGRCVSGRKGTGGIEEKEIEWEKRRLKRGKDFREIAGRLMQSPKNASQGVKCSFLERGVAWMGS